MNRHRQQSFAQPVAASRIASAPAESMMFLACGLGNDSAVAWVDLPGPALHQLVSRCDTRTQACLAQSSKTMYWALKPMLAARRREAIKETKARLMQRLQEATNAKGESAHHGDNGTTDIYRRFAPKIDFAFLQIVSTMVDHILLRFHRE